MIINAKELSSVFTKCQKFTSNHEFVPLALRCFKFQGNLIMAMDRHRGTVYELEKSYHFDEFFTVSNFIARVFSRLEGEPEFEVESNHIKIEN